MNRSFRLGLGMLALGVLAGPARAGSWSESWTSDSSYRQFAYALVQPDEDEGGASILAGTEADHSELKRQSGRIEGAFVWMRSGSKRYVIQDPALVARAKDILEPEAEMNLNQGKLGEMQGNLGQLQGELGQEQGKLGARQARLAERQAKLAGLEARTSPDVATRDQIQRLKAEIDAEQEELGRAQANLGEKQGKMGKDQERLGAEQKRAGEHRAEVTARIRAQMRSLLDDAIRSGAARSR
jgi:bla regulator protein BlaR1